MKTSRMLNMAAVILCMGLPLTLPVKAEAKIIFGSSFEDGTRGFKTHTDGCSKNRAFSTVSNPARRGKALKISLKDCDKRGELYLDGILRGGQERWIGWSLYIPEDYPNGSRHTLLQQQFTKEVRRGGANADKKKCGSEADSHKLFLENGKLSYYVFDNQDSKNLVCKNSPMNLKKGQWTDLVMNAKLDGSDSGFIKIWQDGKLVVNHRGNLGTSSNRFKLGQYQGNRVDRTLYLDEVKIGDSNSSYEEVAPGGGRNRGTISDPPRSGGSGEGNLALNRPVKATAAQKRNEPSHAVDGNPNNRWSARGFAQGIKIDLGGEKTISKLELFPDRGRAYGFVLRRDDGKVIVDRRDNTDGGDVTAVSFPPIPAKEVEVIVTSCNDGPCTDWVSLKEIKLFGR